MFFKHHRNTINSVSLLIRRRLLSRLSCTEKQFILTRPYIRIQLSLVPFWLHSVFNGLERVALQGLFPEVKVPFHDFYQQHQAGRGTPNMLNPRNRRPLYTDGERYRSPLSVAAYHQARRNGVVADDAHPGFEYIQTRGSMTTTHPILVTVTGEHELCWNCGQIKTPQRLD